MRKIEKHKLISSITKEALPLKVKVEDGKLSGENNQRQEHNMKLFLGYTYPIILQIERVKLISLCLDCKKRTKESNNIIITLEDYFKDIYGLFERVLSLIKYVYKINSPKRGIDYVIHKLKEKKSNSNISSLIKKLQEIKSNEIYKIILDIRINATHYNSPMRDDENIKKLIKYELILNTQDSIFYLEGDFKKILRKTKKRYKENMNKINDKTEKDILELLDIIYKEHTKYIKTLDTTPKKFSINIQDKFI